ncbi:MAG: sigma-70 family RNA polymerase sigma factor, partial [Actinomycetota bacterium]|nr:sigma-70 family RNA polymerase sigma factor [Actinomycetota bacterium]
MALGCLRDTVEAHDAYTDALLVAVQHVGSLRAPEAFTPWLQRIVRNVCLARLRRRTPALVSVEDVTEDLVNAGTPTEETLESQLLGDWIWAALAQLPEHLRLVVMLRYFGQQHPYAQVAAVLGVPVGT